MCRNKKSALNSALLKAFNTTLRSGRDMNFVRYINSAVWTGLEPATPCVTGMYSNQLNYQTNFFSFAGVSNS